MIAPMARIHRSRPEIVDLVTLAVALDRDEQRPRAEGVELVVLLLGNDLVFYVVVQIDFKL